MALKAVDLANMMLVLATAQLRAGLPAGRLQFNDDEIAEAFTATSGITMPPSSARPCATRAATCTPTSSACCPEVAAPIAIQRWSIRRVGLMVGVALLALLALTALSSFGAAGLLGRLLPLALACLVLAGCAVGPQAESSFPRGHEEPACTTRGGGDGLVVLMAQAGADGQPAALRRAGSRPAGR